MAKKSVSNRNEKRKILVDRAYESRQALKKVILTTDDDDAREEAIIKLQKRPRNESSIRVRNRCNSCGRPHGTLRKFGICRICLRNLFCKAGVPGLRKASW